MIIRQLKSHQYERLFQQLVQYAQAEPMSASYTVPLCINQIEYQLKVQPERHCKMAALQAVRIHRSEEGRQYELILDAAMLQALLEILIRQGLHNRT